MRTPPCLHLRNLAVLIAKPLLLSIAVLLAALGALAACAPVATLNALAPRGTYTLTANVAYGQQPRQQLDIYHPKGAAPAGGWPVVVFFYGGSWTSGARADYQFVGEALAARGVVTLLADYRLYPEVRYPDFLVDSAHALAYALDHAAALGGDPRRVFVMGHSAGGYNAAMLALDPRWLAATGHNPHQLAGWIGLAGPYNFLPIGNRDAQPVFFHPNYPPGTQPVDYASPSAPPAFLGVADGDSLVDPHLNTDTLAARLMAAGAPVAVRRYQSLSHATLIGVFARPLRGLAPVLADVVAFIDAH